MMQDLRVKVSPRMAYDLVSIDSQELATALKQYPDHWIGLDDKLIEGAFTWVNGQGLGVGSTLGEDPWGANEPNVNQNNIIIIEILINEKSINAIIFLFILELWWKRRLCTSKFKRAVE